MQSDDNMGFLLLAIAATLGMLVLGVSIILFIVFHSRKMMKAKIKMQEAESDYQKKLLSSVIESQENERERIARDLHDDIGGSLSALKLNIGLLLKGSNQDMKSHLLHAKDLIDNTADSVRRISMDLLPVTLSRLGLSSSLGTLCSNASNTYTEVSFEEHGNHRRLLKQFELGVYRIGQELVINALKHAKATSIEVILNWSNDNLILSVIDNGAGFNTNEDNSTQDGLGLDNINSRVRVMNAELSIDSTPMQGTKTVFTLELNDN